MNATFYNTDHNSYPESYMEILFISVDEFEDNKVQTFLIKIKGIKIFH